ncbi:unnamed protein product, partial [marine sediment metagenome]
TEIPSSKMKMEIIKILLEEGYIKDYEIEKNPVQDRIKIYLKYGPNKQRVVTVIRRISKPGLRVYAKKDEIPRVLGGLGISIISTSKGVLTGRNARKLGVGGEVICYVW